MNLVLQIHAFLNKINTSVRQNNSKSVIFEVLTNNKTTNLWKLFCQSLLYEMQG